MRIYPDQLRIVRALGSPVAFYSGQGWGGSFCLHLRAAWTEVLKKPRWVLRVRPWARESPCLVCIVDQSQSVDPQHVSVATHWKHSE